MSDFIIVKTPSGDMVAEVDSRSRKRPKVKLLSRNDSKESTLENLTKKLKDNSKFIIDELSDLGISEIEITCGITVGGETGNSFWGLAKVTGEANFNIKIKCSPN